MSLPHVAIQIDANGRGANPVNSLASPGVKGVGREHVVLQVSLQPFAAAFSCQKSCRAESGIAIEFSSQPDKATRAQIAQQLSAQGLKPKHPMPVASVRYWEDGLDYSDLSRYRWELSGAKPDARYSLIQPDPNSELAWRGVLESLPKPSAPVAIKLNRLAQLKAQMAPAPHAFSSSMPASLVWPAKVSAALPEFQFSKQTALYSGDGFQRILLEASAGLELEARALVPKQLYVGDLAIAGAEIRNASKQNRRVIAGLEWLGSDQMVERSLMMQAGQAVRVGFPMRANVVQTASVLARAQAQENQSGAAADAVLANFEIVSTLGTETLRQDVLLPAGTNGAKAEFAIAELLRSKNPIDATLQLSASRNPMAGLLGLNEQMRVYPYRCFEQQLSRALSAAYLLDANQTLGLSNMQPAPDLSWTAAALTDPLNNLQSFLDEQSMLRYFPGSYYSDEALTWYGADSFAELHRMTGAKVPEALRDSAVKLARAALDALAKQQDRVEPERAAHALAVLSRHDEASDLTPYLKQHLPKILSHTDDRDDILPELRLLDITMLDKAVRAEILRRVRSAGKLSSSGLRRDWHGAHSYWWGGRMRDSCSVLKALVLHDQNESAKTLQQQWLRGIFDQYASSQFSQNTQEIAICLGAAQSYAKRWISTAADIPVEFSILRNMQTQSVGGGRLSQNTPQTSRQIPLKSGIRSASIHEASGSGDVVASVVVTQTVDLAKLPATSHGLALTRIIEVRRSGAWQPLKAGEAVRVGDWLRVRLQLRSPNAGQMLAINEPLPGGLRAVDPSLEGVAEAGILQASQGSDWFFSANRVIEDTRVQFFSEYFPASQFQASYVAQARFAGEFVWLGSAAELMYSPQIRARAAAFRLRILP